MGTDNKYRAITVTVVIYAMEKTRAGKGQGAVLNWVNREGLSDVVTSEQKQER